MKVLAKIISRSQNFEFLAYLNVIDIILDFYGRGGGHKYSFTLTSAKRK